MPPRAWRRPGAARRAGILHYYQVYYDSSVNCHTSGTRMRVDCIVHGCSSHFKNLSYSNTVLSRYTHVSITR